MASKLGMKWVCAAAVVLAWVATNGVAVTFAGSPSKKPPGVSISDLKHSADEAANGGDYFTALRLYRQLAEKGDAQAQNTLAVMIAGSNPKEAVKWFKLSAAQGYAEAEFRLGSMYEEGNGVPQDNDEAMKWYKLSAAHGYANAAYKLGTKQQTQATPLAGTAFADEIVLTKTLTACKSKDVLSRSYELLAHDDTDAARALLERSGCFLLRAGDAVTVMDEAAIVNPLVAECLRPHGDPDCYWAVRR